jgi:hypothetical protein
MEPVCSSVGSMRTFISSLSLVGYALAISSIPAIADSSLPSLNSGQMVAQAAPPQFIPTDVTPFTVNPERNAFNPGYKFRVFQALPERLWFTASTEVSQRLDTNVLFTADHPKADYAFRVLPNLTVGYNIAKNTSVYANYFVIKDTFATNQFLNDPTTQSMSWGIQHVKSFNAKTSLQYNFQARELWQARNLHQFDFIPGITLTHRLTPRSLVYASALLQMRGGEYFVAPTREIDPFYTVGFLRSKGLWTFIATDTLVTNFRHPTFSYSVPNQGNVSMIADIELNRPILKKFPSALAFVRAEPVFNWSSHRTPGISGFDFRLYTGIRFILSKPSYYAATQNMKKQLMNKDQSPDPNQSSTSPSSIQEPSKLPAVSLRPAASPIPAASLVPATSTIPSVLSVQVPSTIPAVSLAPTASTMSLAPLTEAASTLADR